ncbi:carboxypeptidase-like regulatory domain-containing protein, partial [Neisseria sp. P0017.S005]|uniref:carboxypeptidase-like regulatory domain-containing protein n=1 Tax=Neisseria sp. P0017.S005 TaxID=3436781 RepID=UPI003F816B9B
MSIGGTVRYNATSRPAAGAAVDLFSSANTAIPLSSATAAADGTYLFEGLTAGAYKVRYSLTDYKTTWYYSADTLVV